MREWVPPVAAAVYWFGVALRARYIKKRTGRSANLLPRSARERLLWIGWILVIALWALAPQFSRTGMLDGPVSLACGLAAVATGLAGTVWSHLSMGDAWRVGIRQEEVIPLVTSGPFRWVRHPIYAFQCLLLLGVLLLAPSPVMLFTLFLHRILVSMKIRDEETHLEARHGPLYKEYASRTGTLWPKFNRA